MKGVNKSIIAQAGPAQKCETLFGKQLKKKVWQYSSNGRGST
jgi:hypothetical protein